MERQKYHTVLPWHERLFGSSPWAGKEKQYGPVRKLLLTLGVVVLGASLTTIYYSKQVSAQGRAFDDGISALRTRDYVTAQTILKKVTESDPSNALAFYELGNAYYMLDRQPQAVSSWTEAFRLDPKMDQAYIARGVLYFNNGDFAASLRDFNEAVVLSPSKEAYLQQGLALQALGNHQAALESFDEAIARTSQGNPYLTKARAVSLKALNKTADSGEAIKE